MAPTAATAGKPSPPGGGRVGQTRIERFESRLRQEGPVLLPNVVTGPVVVLDLDTGVVSTLCGDAARTAARDWGTKLADPERPLASCKAGKDAPPVVACSQHTGGGDVIHLEFFTGKPFHLTIAMIGHMRTAGLSTMIRQATDQLTVATCP